MARPPALYELLLKRGIGESVHPEQFEQEIRQSVRDVVAHQAQVGLSILNDGEQSKAGYNIYLKDRLSGFEVFPDAGDTRQTFEAEVNDFPEFYRRSATLANEGVRKAARRVRCTGPIGWKDFSEVERDIANLKSAAAAVPHCDVFMSSVSPSLAANFHKNEYYATDEEYGYALATALSREYKAIVDAGLLLQIDLPLARFRYAGPGTGGRAELTRERRKRLQSHIELINFALEHVDPARVRMHICYGSDAGPHHLDPELGEIVDILLGARPSGLTLVGTSGRHEHEWQVWNKTKLPEGKVLTIGVIDHTTNVIEHPATVADRIVRYANVVGRERIVAGVDCGFDPIAGLEEVRVDRRIMWAKLRSLVEGAELATGQLWGRA